MFYCDYCKIVLASFFPFILPICNKNQSDNPRYDNYFNYEEKLW